MTAAGSPIHDRQSALAFLYGRIDYERTRSMPYRSRRFKLDRMRQLAELLGHPEEDFPAVHIAGTKGKGSTACMIAAALSESGLRTGLYTSPHLQRLEERFVVNEDQCTEEELVSLIAAVQPAVAALDRHADGNVERQRPTYFEITTAAALLHFRRKQVDCAVLEVGLGGRLDSTNICHPAVSVITTISLDHTRQLGKTLGQIAREKAGIIKSKTPVVTGVRQKEPFSVIESIAGSHGCSLLAAGRDFDFAYLGPQPAATGQPVGCAFDYSEGRQETVRTWRQVHLGMLGRHQAANGAVAVATLGQLQHAGWNIDDAAIRRGLARARCAARLEILGDRPAVVLDAAHNPASVAALVEVLEEQFVGRPRLLVFASSIDKDVRKMLARLLPCFQHTVLTRYLNNPRAMDPAEAEKLARKLARERDWPALRLECSPDPPTAWQRVRALATPEHVICVAGSFFLAAEVREFLDTGNHSAEGVNWL